MRLNIEVIRNSAVNFVERAYSTYPGNLAARTLGIDGFIHGRHTALTSPEFACKEEPAPSIWGLVVGGAQLTFPDFARPLMHLRPDNEIRTAVLGTLGLVSDLGLRTATIVNTYDPEPVVWALKIAGVGLGMNVISQVGADFTGRFIDRPSPAILAI